MLNQLATSSTLDKSGRVMMDVIGDNTADMATKDELQAAADEAMPVPRANLEAESIEDVYDPKELIGDKILPLIPINDWQDSLAAKEAVKTPSRFVANRIVRLGSGPRAVLNLRILRYLLFLVQLSASCKPGAVRGTKRIPPRTKLRDILAPAPEAIIQSILRKFSEDGEMRKFHQDLLMTHCCVFGALLDGFTMHMQDLKDDLRVGQKELNEYFHSVGGRVRPVSDKEKGKAKADGPKHLRYIGKLSLPLDFPRQRFVQAKRK